MNSATTEVPFCAIHKRPHRLCAICHVTNATMALCSDCRADPVNSDWNPRSIQRDRAAIEEVVPGGELVAALRDHKPRPVSLIRQQVLSLLRDYQIREPRRPRGRRRYKIEWEWEQRPLHVAEVAFLVNRSCATVREILISVEKHLVLPVLARAAERSE